MVSSVLAFFGGVLAVCSAITWLCLLLKRLPLFVSMGTDSRPAICRLGACASHVPTLCLCCTRSFVSLAWRSSNVAFLLVLCKSLFSSKWFSLLLFLVVPVVVRPLLESFLFSFVMPRLSRSTCKSLSALSYPSPVKSTACSSWSPQLADSLTEAVLRAIRNSIPDRFIDPEQRPLARFFFGCGRFC